jgi:hypothetical protein
MAETIFDVLKRDALDLADRYTDGHRDLATLFHRLVTAVEVELGKIVDVAKGVVATVEGGVKVVAPPVDVPHAFDAFGRCAAHAGCTATETSETQTPKPVVIPPPTP